MGALQDALTNLPTVYMRSGDDMAQVGPSDPTSPYYQQYLQALNQDQLNTSQSQYDAMPQWLKDFQTMIGRYGASAVGDAMNNGQLQVPAEYSSTASDILRQAQANESPGNFEQSTGLSPAQASMIGMGAIAGGAAGLYGGAAGAGAEGAAQAGLAEQGLQGMGELSQVPALTQGTNGLSALAGGTGDATLLGSTGTGAGDTLTEQTLGNGLRTGATSSGIGGGELGTGLTAGTGTGATIGGGDLGTGLLTAGGVAGGALAPGYFASETAAPVIGGATSAAASGLAGQTGSGVASGAAPVPGGTSNGMWDRIANGSATASDWAMLSGGIVPGLLGYLGSSQQTDALTNLANQYVGMGAPYRDQLANLYTPEGINSYLHSAEVTTPVQQGTDALSRSLSINGNPAGSGHALQELQDYATGQLSGKLGQERDRLAGFGGLTSYNQAAPAAATGAIQSQGNEWNSIGYGLGRTLNPQPNFAQMFGFKGLV